MENLDGAGMKAKSPIRLDQLPHSMNAGKEAKIRALLGKWRIAAAAEASAQWRLFFETGRGNKYSGDKRLNEIVGAARLQMVRYQVVGMLDSYISNRQNDFREIVKGSKLNDHLKHQLRTVNALKAWYSPDAVVMEDGEIVSDEARQMARRIMRHLFNRNRKPTYRRIGMVIDQRGVEIEASKTETFDFWLKFGTLEGKVYVPITQHENFKQREGLLKKSIQVSERDGKLVFGFVKDVGEAFAASRAAYAPKCEAISVDFGLTNLFTTNEGDLLGRSWLSKLEWYDVRISKLAAYLQSRGQKPSQSKRYRKWVARMRGFVKTEINRVLNRLVAVKMPRVIVAERLNFQNQNLSRRLNRLISRCGRAVISQKLNDLTERFGIRVEEQNPAYSSQECVSCGYVSKKNRPTQAVFKCRFCGHTAHADVKAARMLMVRRSRPESRPGQSKGAVLQILARRFLERHKAVYGYRRDLMLEFLHKAGIGDQFTGLLVHESK